MQKACLIARSALLWAACGLHIAVVYTFLVLLGIFIDPRRPDRPQRAFFRNILRIAGVKFEVRRSPRFAPKRTSIFVCHHVNIFDPFVIYSAIPQFVRGFELESHFKVPIYGWMMGRFGDIPVPANPSRDGLETMTQRAKAALDSGISPIAFAQGSRTSRRPRARLQKGRFPHRPTLRDSHRAHEHRRLLRILPNRTLDAASGKNHDLPARHARPHKCRAPECRWLAKARPGNRCRTGRRIP